MLLPPPPVVGAIVGVGVARGKGHIHHIEVGRFVW